jgi:hypothetical protein
MSPETIPMEPPQPAGMSEMSRLSGVFFEPKKTFEDISARPAFIVPLLLVILSGVIFTAMMGQRVGWPEIARQSMQMNPRAAQQMEQVPPEQRDRMMSMQNTLAPVTAYAGQILGIPIGLLMAAGVFMLILKVMMSVPLRFKQVFAVLAYASLPNLIQNILKMVVLYLKKPDEFSMLNPLAFNPGAFMDFQSSSKFVYTIARSLDVFTFWMLILMAVGFSAAGGKKLSFGGALTAVLIPWALLVLLGASIAGIFS